MEKAIIGKKVGMSQIFDADGKVIPVTVIEAGPCVVVQKKTSEKDGYEAVQLGFGDVGERKLTKPEKGHLDKAGVSPKKHLKEFKLNKAAEMNVGDVVKADAFAEGDHVDVTGISKGHGYAGVVKRHGNRTLKATHGTGPVARHQGSLGSGTDPSRIFKGTKGAGHMGADHQQHAGGPRRGPRPQGRPRYGPLHRQDHHRQEGRGRYQRQPAEGFRPCQPAEGLRETLRERRVLRNDESFEHGRQRGRPGGAQCRHLRHRAQYARCA